MKFSTQITALKHSLTIITLQIENNTIQQQYNSLYGAVSQETELLGCWNTFEYAMINNTIS